MAGWPSLSLSLSLWQPGQYITHRSLSLLVNIISKHSIFTPLTVNISFANSASVNPLSTFPGFAGRAARCQAVKQTLDMQVHRYLTSPTVPLILLWFQWGKDTMYQEDYVSLLTATEIPQRISYSPSSFSSLLPSFGDSIGSAVEEVTLFHIFIEMVNIVHLADKDIGETGHQCQDTDIGSNNKHLIN